MKIKLSMMFLMVITSLAACGAPSVEDFSEDPALLQETIAKCMVMNPDKVKEDEACKNAGIAMQNAQKNMMGNMMNMLGK